MFFNESLYFEDAAPAEMSDEVVEAEAMEAQAEAEADTKAEPVQEGTALYALYLEGMMQFNEDYFNLREKMMNMEHIASLKESKGLVSESEMILQESSKSFFKRVQQFFEDLGEKIKELFNRFVNFVYKLFVNTKDVLNVNAKEAWKNYGQDKLTVNVLNLDNDEMASITAKANKILLAVRKATTNLSTMAKGKVEGNANEMRTKIEAYVSDAYKSFTADASSAKGAVADYVFANLGDKDGNNTVLGKVKKDIDESEFTKRVDYVKGYQKAIAKIKEIKDNALKTIDDCKKFVKNIESEDDNVNSRSSMIISACRKFSATVSSIFTKLTSVSQNYYRESMSIARTVIGTGRREAKKDEKKSEGFDFDAYFA